MGSSTENSAFGPTFNPWDKERTPGGSGGGSAAALASYEAPLAIGTDTGGSIRQPAALTATVGVKPTYGTVSRYGLVACASSLDQGGPCARTVLDTAMLHNIIAGHDEHDSTSLAVEIPDMVSAAVEGQEKDLSEVKVGVIKEFLTDEGCQPGVAESFQNAVETLEGWGQKSLRFHAPTSRTRWPPTTSFCRLRSRPIWHALTECGTACGWVTMVAIQRKRSCR